MALLFDQLLERLLAAAQSLAEPPPNHENEAPPASPTSNGPEILCPEGLAMDDLLRRQARPLIKTHEATVLGESPQNSDHGRLLKTRLDDLASISMSKFYSYRFDQLPYYWRRIYTDTLILMAHHRILETSIRSGCLSDETLDSVVELLDRAIIVAGGAGKVLGAPWIEGTLQLLEECSVEKPGQNDGERPSKRLKTTSTAPQRTFRTDEPHVRPQIRPERQLPRHSGWTLHQFETYMADRGKGEPLPVVFTDLMGGWPALDTSPWNSPDYLLSKTFGGRRLVPVEVGRSYVDEGWGQELIPFKTFLGKYVDSSIRSGGQGQGDGQDPPDPHEDDADDPQDDSQTGYLAQHSLLTQIPSLRNDIRIPDFCWAAVPPHPTDPSKNQPPVDIPHLNAWFGPARTITPLHTDGYHNLLCQVVGTKYVRLYPPRATPCMRPRAPEHGVDMSNTSELDVGVLEGWDACPEGMEDDVEQMRRATRHVEYWEGVLGEGDTLVIPIGWWHYVRSLSVSFSVSFWWN